MDLYGSTKNVTYYIGSHTLRVLGTHIFAHMSNKLQHHLSQYNTSKSTVDSLMGEMRLMEIEADNQNKKCVELQNKITDLTKKLELSSKDTSNALKQSETVQKQLSTCQQHLLTEKKERTQQMKQSNEVNS